MNLEDIKEEIKINSGVMIYFSGTNCGVCEVLKPKIKSLFDEDFSKIKQFYINAQENPQISAYFNVFSVPTILVFLDSKEFIRKSRNISISVFKDELSRPYNLFFN